MRAPLPLVRRLLPTQIGVSLLALVALFMAGVMLSLHGLLIWRALLAAAMLSGLLPVAAAIRHARLYLSDDGVHEPRLFRSERFTPWSAIESGVLSDRQNLDLVAKDRRIHVALTTFKDPQEVVRIVHERLQRR
jgi:hypothetical protein